jgi:hypothetical protein
MFRFRSVAVLAPNVLMLAALSACFTSGPEQAAAPDVAPDGEKHAEAAAKMPAGQQWVRMLEEQVAASPALAELNADEALVAEVVAKVVEPLEAALRSGEQASATALQVAGAAIADFGAASGEQTRSLDGIVETRMTTAATADLAAMVQALQPGNGGFVELRLTSFVPAEGAARATVAFDVRGGEGAARRHDRGELAMELSMADGAWRIQSLAPTTWDRVTLAEGRSPSFADVTAAMGLDEVPRIDRREAIRRGGYALAVSDFDGDQRVDLLVGHFGKVQLLRNTPEGFVDVTDAAGLQGETKVKAASFADVDNDGDTDILLVRFVPANTDMGSEFVAYSNNGDGTFASKGDPLVKGRNYDRSMPLAMADYDRDGLLDVYIGFPGVADFTNLPQNSATPDLVTQGLWLGKGDWTFAERELQFAGMPETAMVFPHAAMSADLDDDGLDDLIIVDDRGNENPVYRNNGDGTFTDITSKSGLALGGWGMGAVVADYDGDGLVDVYMTNVDLPARERLLRSWEGRGSEATQAALAEMTSTVRGNGLFRNQGDGTFKEVSAEAGVAWAGAGPGVPEWVDYNNDGFMDLYVPNGLWSGGDQDFESLFVRAAAGGIQLGNDLVSGSTDLQLPFKNPGLQMLREFRGQLGGADAADGAPSLSLAGHQRNFLFRNNGDGTFTEVGFLEGVDSQEDGYIAAVSDYDRDGRADLIMRHADGSPGRETPTLSVFHNEHPNTNALVVTVTGTQSNRDGLGTKVTAWVGERKIVRHIRGVGGATQSEPAAFFGLADASSVTKLEVAFPSGDIRIFEGVAKGWIHVTEGNAEFETLAKLAR